MESFLLGTAKKFPSEVAIPACVTFSHHDLSIEKADLLVVSCQHQHHVLKICGMGGF